MNRFEKFAFALVGALVATLWGYATFAQGISPDDLSFFERLVGLLGKWELSAGIALVVSSLKVSFLRPLWDKLGDFKIWAGPVLGLVAGFFSMGTSLTLEAALAYLTAGAGAIFMHEILDMVKKIPGIGAVWLQIIDVIKLLLRAPPAVIGSFVLGFFAVSMLFTTSGCTGKDSACEVAKLVAKPVAAGLGHLASCSNPAALEPWLIERIKAIKPDLCEAKPSVKSIVGEIICPSLIEGVIGGGIGLLPADAKCTGGQLAETAKAELLKLCKESI